MKSISLWLFVLWPLSFLKKFGMLPKSVLTWARTKAAISLHDPSVRDCFISRGKAEVLRDMEEGIANGWKKTERMKAWEASRK